MRYILLAAAAFAATAATAQDAASPAPGGMADARTRLMAADTNKDGKWDKPEWLAAGRREQGFTYIDTDKDGFISQDELKAGMEKMRAMRGN